ncbi:MAG TPA: hypothetical protein DCQ37_10075 [Desulfobacteraceae bacterium]|nr:hypothetical protein [Desulfobacteraceae bacterium]
MSESEKRDEFPLYLNRKASTVVVRENGKIFIKEGGAMTEPQEVKKTPDISELSKSVAAEIAAKPQSAGNGGGKDAAGNIDKIRDLIFGNQMQDYEKRFGRLEERMFKEMTDSKSESKKNFDSLEKYLNKEIEMLKDRISQEQNTRTEAFKELSRQLKDTTRSFEKKIDSMGDQFNESSNDLRQQISDLSLSLRNDVRQKYEEILYAIEQTADELRTNKVDRSALSGLLSEMAMRIANDRT